MTRRSRALAATALIAFALATPLGGRAVGRACAAGTVHIAVVVDSGSGSSVSAVCVPGGSRDNGASILAARASLLGTPQPRFNASGLLCAIDGLPQTGCGEQHKSQYSYWSYFHGTGGKWSYSSFGPGSWRVDGATVEGWRWQPDGAGLPTDPPPRGPASAGAVCAPQSTPTTARPVASGTVASGPATAGTTAPHTGVTTPAVTSRTTPSDIGPQTPGKAPAGGTVGSTADPTNKTATTAGGHRATTTGDASSTASSTASSIALTAGGIAAPPAGRSSGGAPVGVIVGVLLVVALGAGGAVAARRRSRAAA
jgi:hypothetical protein